LISNDLSKLDKEKRRFLNSRMQFLQ